MSTVEQSRTHTLTANQPRSRSLPASASKVIVFIVLSLLSVLFLIPFFWMISTSLKDAGQAFDGNWIPQKFVWNNYTDAFSYGKWGQWTLNTIIIVAVSVFGSGSFNLAGILFFCAVALART